MWLGLTNLQQHGFIEYEDEAEVVLDRQALKHYQPKGSRQLKGAVTSVASVPPNNLESKFMALTRILAPNLYQALMDESYLDHLREWEQAERSGNGKGIDTPSIVGGGARQLEEELDESPSCSCGSTKVLQRYGSGFICPPCLEREKEWGFPIALAMEVPTNV